MSIVLVDPITGSETLSTSAAQGQNGPQGPAGPQGAAGEDGEKTQPLFGWPRQIHAYNGNTIEVQLNDITADNAIVDPVVTVTIPEGTYANIGEVRNAFNLACQSACYAAVGVIRSMMRYPCLEADPDDPERTIVTDKFYIPGPGASEGGSIYLETGQYAQRVAYDSVVTAGQSTMLSIPAGCYTSSELLTAVDTAWGEGTLPHYTSGDIDSNSADYGTHAVAVVSEYVEMKRVDAGSHPLLKLWARKPTANSAITDQGNILYAILGGASLDVTEPTPAAGPNSLYTFDKKYQGSLNPFDSVLLSSNADADPNDVQILLGFTELNSVTTPARYPLTNGTTGTSGTDQYFMWRSHAKDKIHCNGTQTLNVTTGVDYKFYAPTVSTRLTLTSDTTFGVLKAGKTYRLFARFQTDGLAADESLVYEFVDAKDNSALNDDAFGKIANLESSVWGSFRSCINILYKPTADMSVKLRCTGSEGTISVLAGDGHVNIVEVD